MVALPIQTGPFSVGRTIYEWTDVSRDERFSDLKGEHRSVVVCAHGTLTGDRDNADNTPPLSPVRTVTH